MLCAFLCVVFILSESSFAQTSDPSAFRIGRVKYAGGGDWYNDPSAEVNLLRFVGEQTGIDVHPAYEPVELSSDKIFSYPFLFLTGHGNILLSDAEIAKLRLYLEHGGFLYADDDYGMDKAFRREMKKVFPGREMVELPLNYGLYNSHFTFTDGPPKIHEHDGKAPQGFGIFSGDRLVVMYTVESNPGDGWADPEAHGNPPGKREEALRFGCNLVVWALTH
jgi:hypothetical protein